MKCARRLCREVLIPVGAALSCPGCGYAVSLIDAADTAGLSTVSKSGQNVANPFKRGSRGAMDLLSLGIAESMRGELV